MVNEKYLIGGKEYKLSNDQSWEEIEELEKLFDRLKTANDNLVTIEGNYTREEIQHALFLILAPADGGIKKIDDFKKATPKQSTKIIADFFLFIAVLNIITKNGLPEYSNA